MTCYKQGLFDPVAVPWCNAFVLVQKKDGGLCFLHRLQEVKCKNQEG